MDVAGGGRRPRHARRARHAGRGLLIAVEVLLILASLAVAAYFTWRAVDEGITAPALPTVTAPPSPTG